MLNCLYFAALGQGGGGLALIISIAIWVPSHYFFKWIRLQYKSNFIRTLCIVLLSLITIGLIVYGTRLGNENSAYNDFLNSTNDGVVQPKTDSYIGWLPFYFLAAGTWMGFLTGYIKMPIPKK